MGKKKKKENPYSTIAYIILGIAVAYAINFGLSFVLATDMPVVAVESNSMVPAFAKGDILLLQGQPASLLKVGDIIVYSPPGQSVPIVHRIITINPDGTFQTKGDANAGQLAFERSIEPSQIHGRVIFIIPYAGWIKIAVTSYVMPNLVWVVLAIVLVVVAARAPRYINGSVKI